MRPSFTTSAHFKGRPGEVRQGDPRRPFLYCVLHIALDTFSNIFVRVYPPSQLPTFFIASTLPAPLRLPGPRPKAGHRFLTLRPHDSGCLTVSAVNVNGLRGSQSRLKAATICHLFTDAPQDIVCLLDTRLDPTTEPHLTQHWQKKSLFVHNTLAHTNGIALLFNTDKAKINQTIADPQGRYVLVVAEVNAQPLLIVPVYAPASSPVERRLFFEHLHRQIDLVKTERHNVIMLGDFNVTENDVMDRLAATGSKDPSLPALRKILSTHSLEDFLRKSHPHDVSYTFRGVRGSSSRIDRVYTSRQFRNLLIKSDILPFVHSDHDMVEVTLRISATLRGNGIWSLDPELLAEEAYRETIISLIGRWSATRDHFPSLLE